MLLQFLVISDLSVATFVIPHITRFKFKQIQFAVLLSVLVHLLMQVCVCVCVCLYVYAHIHVRCIQAYINILPLLDDMHLKHII